MYGPCFVTSVLRRMRQGDPEFGAWLGYKHPKPNQENKAEQNPTKTNPPNKNLSNNETKPYTFFKALLLFIIILHLIPKQNGLLLFPSGVFSKQLSFLAKVLRSKEDLLKIEWLTSNQLKFLSSTRISFNLFAFRTVGFSKQEQVRTTPTPGSGWLRPTRDEFSIKGSFCMNTCGGRGGKDKSLSSKSRQFALFFGE